MKFFNKIFGILIIVLFLGTKIVSATYLGQVVSNPPTGVGAQNVGTVSSGGETYDVYVGSGQNGQFGPTVYSVKRKDDDDNGPVDRDPRAYERWRVIGDFNSFGASYKGRNNPCTGAPGEDKNRCNNTCFALEGWACDTRPHERPVSLHVYVDGVFYDAFFPTGSWPGLTNNWWANQNRFNYTPNCGDSPDNLYGYRYITPPAWKDGRYRNIKIYAIAASSTINSQYYHNGVRLRIPGPFLTGNQLLTYGLSSGGYGRIKYRFLYGESTAPSTVDLANAGWSPQVKDFPVQCPALPNQVVDLTGRLGLAPNQIVNRPYNLSSTISNLGTAPATIDIPLWLQFDYGRNGFTNGRNNDFTIKTTMRALAAGASADNLFRNITHSQLGAWQVRLYVDPELKIEADSLSRQNNWTIWEPFLVTVAPGTPTLDLVANTPVKVGESIGLGWFGANLRDSSCVATGAWAGARDEKGFIVIPATVAGTLSFTLSCVGTDNKPITDTATVQVISATPDLLFTNVGYTTCTPAQQNPQTGACPATTVSFVIRNQGTAIPPATAIAYQVDRQVGATWVPVAGAAGSIAGLASGANSTVITRTVPNLAAGPLQRFRFQVNNLPTRNLAIGEVNFANNATTTGFFQLAVPVPDYSFTGFTVTGTCPQTGIQNQTTGSCPQTTISMTIRNIGAGTPAGQMIGYTVEESGTTLVQGTTPALPAGASRTITATVSGLSVGRHVLRGVVNPNQTPALRETDFSNNTSSPDDAVVLPLPPQCNNNNRDDDADGVADRTDPGCYGTGNPNVPADYDPTDDSEADSSAVVPVPSVFSLTATNQVVRFDTSTTIRYQIRNAAPMSCVLRGPGTNRTFLYTMNSVVDQTLPTSNLKSAQSFSLTCTPILIGPAITRTLQIEVIPQVQEV